VREAALTGEAQPVSKAAHAVLADAPLGDRTNLVFQGTEVLQGRGLMVVTNTGMNTELGRIAAMLQRVESEPTPCNGACRLGNVLSEWGANLGRARGAGLVAQTPDGFTVYLQGTSLLQQPLKLPSAWRWLLCQRVACRDHCDASPRNAADGATQCPDPQAASSGDAGLTTICSDKTGTLTQNKMVVQVVHTPSATYEVSGSGYVPEGSFANRQTVQLLNPKQIQVWLASGLHRLQRCCV